MLIYLVFSAIYYNFCSHYKYYYIAAVSKNEKILHTELSIRDKYIKYDYRLLLKDKTEPAERIYNMLLGFFVFLLKKFN